MYKVRCFCSFYELPPAYEALIIQAAESNFFNDRAWFEFLMFHLFPSGSEFRLYAVEDANTGQPLLVIPMRYTWTDPAVARARALAATSHVENYSSLCLIFDSMVKDRAEILVVLFRYLKSPVAENQPSCFDALRLWPVEIGSELAATVHNSLRRAGFWVQVYANSFNHYEITERINYEDYFASRSPNMRYNIRRRRRNLEKSGTLEIKLYSGQAEIERGIADYITVSKASWKSMQSMTNEDWLRLIRLTASKGYLRLGILKLDGKATAAQFWIVSGGVAYCVRLAYDEAYKKQAVGVVLTDYMIAHVLDHDHVAQMDFGYGDDDYKESWMKEYRYYAGYMAFNPGTLRGFYYGVKHIVGQPLKRVIKWLLRLGRPVEKD